jgi:hypothetical protein
VWDIALSCVKKGKGSLITWQVFTVVLRIYGVKREKICPKIHTPFLRPYNGPLWISKSFSAEQYLLLWISHIHQDQPWFTSH